ncbi:MAG: acyltransferase domain-containing protein [Rhodanobacteraceae bacterium]|nr:acyltransferase domain-containing protein [Rhodanobacteraceae bacterium]
MSNDRSSRHPAIAVVGVSALFPGSQDATGFWNDILAGRDLIGDVPASHWRIDDYYDPDPSAPDKTYARRGGFLSPIDFDALGFGIPPATLSATDTSQLLALIVAQAVLEDAARDQIASIDRSRISVILGVTSAQELLFSMVSRLQRPVWVKALRESGLPEDEVQRACDRIAGHYVPWQEASFPGLLGNVVAGRIANRLNLGGTNCVTDAACASTFSALSMAVNELVLGHSDMAIAGGVDTLNDIFMYMCFSKTPALSPSGDCRPFSDQADGTMLGEGLGMVALKRLDDAERDGDRIYAVLRGIGSGSDGRAKSVYAPVAAGQARTLARAYAAAGYGPETVEMVEAHGTGTKAGDAAEFDGLRQVFAANGDGARQWCALGSVKSQIGHTKAAAGAAGLFKTVMALHHKVLPPTIKVAAPNPNLAIADSPFYLNTETRPWIRASDHPRRAAVSAFGFGGSNFHVTLEEYLGPGAKAERLATQSCDLVLLGAATAAELLPLMDAMLASTAPLACIAHDSRIAFDALRHPAHRFAVVAATRALLQQRLLAARARIVAQPDQRFDLADGSSYGVGAAVEKVAFLFPGQGSQYLGMGAAIAMQFEAARRVFDAAADLPMDGDVRLHEVMFPRPAFDDATRQRQQDTLTRTEWAQPALGAHAAALLAQLRELGVGADAHGGHSFGEVVALHAGGAFDAPTVVQIARRRGELMSAAAAISSGAMTAVSVDIDRVHALLAKHAPDLVVANHNALNQVVVSGALAAITTFETILQQQGLAFRRLPVASAFHSPLVASCSDAFAQALKTLPIASLTMPVYGNASGACFPNDVAAMSAQLAAQIANPVRFVDMIEALYADGVRSFVEVGPGGVLSGLVGAILGDRSHRTIALDRKGRDGVESLLIGLARLAAGGTSMQAARLFADTRRPPATASAAKLAVAISGSNYGKPYPPTDPREIPPPNPARAAFTISQTPATPGAVVGTQNMHAQNPPSDAWLVAFQESQQQTAAAHAAFQRTMAESHAAYLKLAESALLGLSGGVPMVVIPTAVAAVVETTTTTAVAKTTSTASLPSSPSSPPTAIALPQ